MKSESKKTHKILVNTTNGFVSQCTCCTDVQVQYKNILLAFEWANLMVFLKRLNDAPTGESYYIVELLHSKEDSRSVTQVAAAGIYLSSSEIIEFRNMLTLACQRLDLDLIFRNSINPN
ncbi:DUF6686 family protein [Flectobacillus major]|jgi:hypothetical protein|uniref:DUF6686 family protein n=1 Tax=Flectobacillus major TaxID=103 RepID=UPI00042A0B30|nr:DUF6686 family protein [Flectobacillus major]